jgi:hypothetical protein
MSTQRSGQLLRAFLTTGCTCGNKPSPLGYHLLLVVDARPPPLPAPEDALPDTPGERLPATVTLAVTGIFKPLNHAFAVQP